MFLMKPQFRGVFDGDNPLFVGDKARENIEKSRFSCARATTD